MRPLSVSNLKGTRKVLPQDKPRQGTKLRELYDFLESERGKIVDVKLLKILYPKDFGIALAQLTDFYGLDIRRLGRGQYCLVGEWQGRRYIDYVAELHQ